MGGCSEIWKKEIYFILLPGGGPIRQRWEFSGPILPFNFIHFAETFVGKMNEMKLVRSFFF